MTWRCWLGLHPAPRLTSVGDWFIDGRPSASYCCDACQWRWTIQDRG